MIEEWRDINGYEGYYQISNLGNVKSLARIVFRNNGVIQHRKERIMSKRKNQDGYYIAKLNIGGKSASMPIHRLVAEAFIPNPDNLPEVNHIDMNRKNNSVGNLEWITHIDNVRHSARNGKYSGRTGKLNPNYGNRKLSRFYKDNPKVSKIKNSRPAERNGRSKRVLMHNDVFCHKFNYLRGAAKYLIENNISTNKNINYISDQISKAKKNGTMLFGYYFD